jgi:hypothetical protein
MAAYSRHPSGRNTFSSPAKCYTHHLIVASVSDAAPRRAMSIFVRRARAGRVRARAALEIIIVMRNTYGFGGAWRPLLTAT